MHFLPADLTILIDNREKHPFVFEGVNTQSASLLTGDYTIPGLENFVAVERKTAADFAYYFAGRRTQLKSQFQRLLSLRRALLVIEGPHPDFDEDYWRRAGVHDIDLLKQTLRSWRADGLQIEYAATHEAGALITQNFLFDIAAAHYQTHHVFFDRLAASPVGANQHSPASINPTPKRAA